MPGEHLPTFSEESEEARKLIKSREQDEKEIAVLLHRNSKLLAENADLKKQKQAADRSKRRFKRLKQESTLQLKELKKADENSQLKIAKIQRELDELQVNFDLTQIEKVDEAKNLKEAVIYFYQYCAGRTLKLDFCRCLWI